MGKNWKDITDDELLGPTGIVESGTSAQYARILQKRSTDAAHALSEKVTALTETIHWASQGQSRQQRVLIGLSAILAICTAAYVWTTWESVSATRVNQRVRLWFLYFALLGSPETEKANNKSLTLRATLRATDYDGNSVT